MHWRTFKALAFIIYLTSSTTLCAQEFKLSDDIIEATPDHVIKKKASLQNVIDSLVNVDAIQDDILKAKFRLCRFLIHRSQYREEIKSLVDGLIDKIDPNKYPKVYASVLSYKGISQYHFGNFGDAIKTHYGAISFKEKIGDPSISWNYELIGTNLMARDNYQESLKSMLKAIELAPKDKLRPKLLQRTGRLYKNLKESDLAKHYYQQSIKRAREIKNKVIEGTSYSLLAEVYYLEKDYQASVKALEQSKRLRRGNMGIGQQIGTNDNLAKNYIALGNFEKATVLADSAYHLASELNSPGFKQATLRTLTDLAFVKKNFEDAERYQKLLMTSVDSFYDIENRKNFHELYTKLELTEKENEIISQDLIIEKEKSAKSTLTYLVGFLTLLSSFVVYVLYKRTKYQQVLKSKNAIILKSLDEKEILLREIHHRVKNNLQMISSLLGIQSRRISDDKAKEAINEGRTRVHSMSLIHQDLYRKDNLTGVEMQNYLPKLSNDLLNTYNVNDNKINLEIDVQDIKLDVETVIPLGLIVNELITNSLKYAFPKNNGGDINIKLHESYGTLELEVSDNGIGLNPDQFNKKEASFGHSLIKAFKSKLDADIQISGENGTSIKLLIKNYKKM